MREAGPAAARLASFAVGRAPSEAPPAVRARAALHLLDTVGCGLAAVGLGDGGHATALAVDQGGRAEASVLGEATQVPAAPAALANGTRCHALDFDDTHEAGICHSSTVVGPAALAVGEAGSRSGREVLDAYIAGSEVALRIAVAAADGLYARGFHPTSVCGAFGSAAAACRLLGLDARQAANALGIVGSFAGGLLEYLSDGSATKPLHAGWASHAGIQAAALAAAGGTGPATVLEGRFGLLASHGAATGDAGAIGGDLGTRWELTNLSIKPFPACHFAHSSTWAVGQLADEHGLRPDDVAEARVSVPPEGEALVLDPPAAKVAPRTPYDAKFSLPFMIGHRLVHGGLDLRSFSPATIRDERVLAVARRVRGEPLAKAAPSRFAGGARVLTARGEQYSAFLDHAPGSPGNPLDAEYIHAKFRANARLAIGPAEADSLLEALLALDDAPSLEPAVAPLRAGRRGA